MATGSGGHRASPAGSGAIPSQTNTGAVGTQPEQTPSTAHPHREPAPSPTGSPQPLTPPPSQPRAHPCHPPRAPPEGDRCSAVRDRHSPLSCAQSPRLHHAPIPQGCSPAAQQCPDAYPHSIVRCRPGHQRPQCARSAVRECWPSTPRRCRRADGAAAAAYVLCASQRVHSSWATAGTSAWCMELCWSPTG